MNAGTLEIEMMANLARLQKDMNDARRVVGSTMSSIKESVAVAQTALVGLGVLGVAGAFVARVKEAIDYADKLDELSQKAGITTESLSQLQYAAKMGGAEAETFNTAMKKLNQSIAAGLSGDKEKVAWFKQLGVTFKDTQGQARGADQVLLDLADSFAKAGNGAGKAAGAVALMGKAGDEMIPLLNGGAQSIRDLMHEADKMGLTISGDFAKAAGDFNDSLDRIDAQSRKLTILMAGEFVTGLGRAMQAMADATMEAGKLAGAVAFWQTLMTGDDRYKNDKALVQQTEEMLRLEKEIGKIQSQPGRSRSDEFRLDKLKGQLADVNGQLKTTQTYRKVLTDQEEAAAAAAAKLKAAQEGRTIKPPTSGGTAESEYERLIKRIQESIALNETMLSQGRDLTAAEKLQVTTLQQMEATKKSLSASERAAIKDLLDENVQRELQVTIEKSQLDEAKKVSEERQRLRTADYEAVAKFTEGEREAQNARSKSMKDVLLAYQDEIAVLGLTNAEREIATRLREVERQGLDKNSAAYAVYAEQVRAAVMKKSELEEAKAGQVEMWQGIDSAARDTFVNIGKNGTNVFDKLKDSLQSGLYSLLYDMTVKKWLITISTQVSGAGVAQQALGSGSGGGIFSGLMNLLSPGSSSGAFIPDSGMASYASEFAALVGLPGRAKGGDVLGGSTYMVGENGPELFKAPGSGTIVPNDRLGTGGMTFAPVSTISIGGGMNQAEFHTQMTRALDARDRAWSESLKKMGVIA